MTIHPMTQTRPAFAFPVAADYQWCYTDRDGKNARVLPANKSTGDTRTDFFLECEERDYTRYFFESLNLPLPCKDNIYRGTSQDLLFLDNYGLVVRTGPLDVIDLAHPGILQPLFWMPDFETGHVIALYPGVQLLKQMNLADTDTKILKDRLATFLDLSGHKTFDINHIENIGIIDDKPIIIDSENLFFGLSCILTRGNKHTAYQNYIASKMRPDQALAMVIKEFYGKKPEYKTWEGVYNAHQPLRAQIHDALNQPTDAARLEKLNQFYRRCQHLTEKPESVIRHHWHVRGQNGQKIWVKEDPVLTEQAALYRPWTGNPADNITKSRRRFGRKDSSLIAPTP